MPGVIDSRRWLRQRQAHLQSCLEGETDAVTRDAIEAELAQVRAELARTAPWRRWLLWGARRPGP